MVNSYCQENEFEKLMEEDWANLEKYRAENEHVKKGSKENLVVFMENSITEGWIATNPKFLKKMSLLGEALVARRLHKC